MLRLFSPDIFTLSFAFSDDISSLIISLCHFSFDIFITFLFAFLIFLIISLFSIYFSLRHYFLMPHSMLLMPYFFAISPLIFSDAAPLIFWLFFHCASLIFSFLICFLIAIPLFLLFSSPPDIFDFFVFCLIFAFFPLMMPLSLFDAIISFIDYDALHAAVYAFRFSSFRFRLRYSLSLHCFSPSLMFHYFFSSSSLCFSAFCCQFHYFAIAADAISLIYAGWCGVPFLWCAFIFAIFRWRHADELPSFSLMLLLRLPYYADCWWYYCCYDISLFITFWYFCFSFSFFSDFCFDIDFRWCFFSADIFAPFSSSYFSFMPSIFHAFSLFLAAIFFFSFSPCYFICFAIAFCYYAFHAAAMLLAAAHASRCRFARCHDLMPCQRATLLRAILRVSARSSRSALWEFRCQRSALRAALCCAPRRAQRQALFARMPRDARRWCAAPTDDVFFLLDYWYCICYAAAIMRHYFISIFRHYFLRLIDCFSSPLGHYLLPLMDLPDITSLYACCFAFFSLMPPHWCLWYIICITPMLYFSSLRFSAMHAIYAACKSPLMRWFSFAALIYDDAAPLFRWFSSFRFAWLYLILQRICCFSAFFFSHAVQLTYIAAPFSLLASIAIYFLRQRQIAISPFAAASFDGYIATLSFAIIASFMLPPILMFFFKFLLILLAFIFAFMLISFSRFDSRLLISFISFRFIFCFLYAFADT